MEQDCDSCLFSLFQHYLHTRGTTVYNLTTGRLVHIACPYPSLRSPSLFWQITAGYTQNKLCSCFFVLLIETILGKRDWKKRNECFWFALSYMIQFSCSVVSNSVTPWTAARQAFLSFTNSWSLLKLMSIESVMPSNYFILCCSLLFLPSIFPSIRVFSSDQLFTSGGQSIGASASAWVLPVNLQGWFPLGWTGLISLLSKGLSRVFSSTWKWKLVSVPVSFGFVGIKG